MEAKIVYRGGDDYLERLFLYDSEFYLQTGEQVIVKRTQIPGVDMRDLNCRHKGRYHLLGLFARPGFTVLDFPCGSGYGSEILREFEVVYQGLDADLVTIEYARHIYDKEERASFDVADLKNPDLRLEQYDLIGCIEGLEHIDGQYQLSLIEAFYKALKSGGTLIISSPENPTGISGKSAQNPYHLWELNREDFVSLLGKYFGPANVEVVTHKAVLSTKVLSTCFYGVCHRLRR